MAATSDVIVIGSGVVGASTALEMARGGHDVTVVDKAGGPGNGSTSASSAIVRFNYSTWEGVAAAWESQFRWQAWEEHLGHRDPDGLARFIRCGLVFLDVDTVPLDAMSTLFDKAGVPHERWDAGQVSQAVPGIDVGRYFPPKPVESEAFFAPADGSLGALFTPDAGYVDDPKLAATNLAHAAERAGAHFRFGRAVTEVQRTSTSWRVTLDSGEVIEAPVVVNAAGPWSTEINRLAGIGAEFTVSVTPLRQEVHHVPLPPRLGALTPSAPIIADLDLGTYLRPESDHSLLVGGTEPECDPLEWVEDPDRSDPRPSRERFEAQVHRSARRLPELAVPNRPRGIAGVYDAASDWTPIYDRTDQDGFYVAMGTSGNQFKNAPLIGSLMAALIEGVEAGYDHDAAPLDYTAPHTGHTISLGAFSRLRSPNAASTGTVLG